MIAQLIVEHGQPPNGESAFLGQEKGCLRILVVRMLFRIQHELRIRLHHRHPLRGVGIDPEWQVEELLPLFSVG